MATQQQVGIESSTSEYLNTVVTARVDPSASAPEWALTTGRRTSPPDVGFVAGSWGSDYVQRTAMIIALSPLVGAGAALDVEEGLLYDVWVRWDEGASRPVKRVGTLLVR